ncbi:MAG: hypothetical protein E5V92_13615 [Mesorhizobium sp.]|uniref:hypothetical protein n=1 Tax=unclassified Mesorhizobium TaxID=325217 RepID=UPI000F74DF6B|nr:MULTISPECIES: hypothetical protein [unclassified Mesorhizobium]AZO70993.1 hypothetical protein EJ067_07085 [Mesorhizobium sp. M1D.F.Ca.ET.043.01.1.1]RWA91193.1 MAG: hypothetical protein EOQ32_16915 [Mesorhizobium sp.]TJW86491.1 MAG: hypothetical protein E5V92_13615 [Mesorhizobium sp.]
MSSDQITFKCNDCGHAVSIDESNPPKDDDILKCFGCGREFGRYAQVKEALIELAKAEIDKMVENTFGTGVKPTWTKG